MNVMRWEGEVSSFARCIWALPNATFRAERVSCFAARPMNANESMCVCVSKCYSHRIKLSLQRGAKARLADYQTKTPWKHVNTLHLLNTCSSGKCVSHNNHQRIMAFFQNFMFICIINCKASSGCSFSHDWIY